MTIKLSPTSNTDTGELVDLPGEISLFDEMSQHPAHLIRRCYQIFIAGFEQEIGTITDISQVQGIILAIVRSYPGIDMTSVSGLAAVDKTSCGRAVSKLARSGLIHISPILEDRRQKRLSITAEGEDVIREVLPGLRKLQDRLLGALSQKEQEHFISALKVFVEKNNEQSRAPQRLLIPRGRPSKKLAKRNPRPK